MFGVVLALTELALLLSEPQYGLAWLVSLFPAIGLVYLGTGLVAWLRRPSNRMGTILCAGGLVWMVAGFVNTTAPALVAAGLVVATVSLAVVVHLLHAFPSGRLRGRVSLWAVLAGYGVCLVLQAPQWLLGQAPGGPTAVLEVAYRHDLARIGLWLQWSVGMGVMVVTAVVLFRRLHATQPAGRRVAVPLFAYGVFAVLFAPVSGQLAVVFPHALVGLITAQLGVLMLVPVAFVVVMLRGGFARTGQLQELGAWLGEEHAARRGLRDALARALGDDSLEVVYWGQAGGGYVDAEGRAVAPPAAGGERGAVEVAADGRRVGAIIYDATLIDDPAEVRAAARVAALAVDRERLVAELRASRERLRASRARLVHTADRERRRIARDLHDGLQARLVVLAMRADRLRGDPAASAETRAEAERLHAELDAAIGELRELVHGVLPASLAERGLSAAVRELADGLPLRAELDLDLDGRRLPAAIESAAYFVVAEALSNAVKHARADRLSVRVGERGGRLLLEVADDGIGGADLAGAGLRGIADRIEALDGRLRVDSPVGAGTRVVAELPCGS